MKPKLSICIPTYNRAKLLEICLNSIVDQLNTNNDLKDIEVVISDNASSDGTRTVVGALQKKNKNIRYFRNKKNIGGDRNIIAAAGHALGDYIWFFGDDDVQYSYSCSRVLTIIQRYKPDAMLCNVNLMATDGKKILENNMFRLDKDCLIRNKKRLFSFLETKFFLPIEWYTTCMSCLIVRKTLFKQNISSVMRSYDPSKNAFLHMGLIYYNTEDYKIYIVATPLIRYRAHNTRMIGPGEKGNRAAHYSMIREVFGSHLKLIARINKKNISLKFRILIEMKHFARMIRVAFLKYGHVDINNVLIYVFEKK